MPTPGLSGGIARDTTSAGLRRALNRFSDSYANSGGGSGGPTQAGHCSKVFAAVSSPAANTYTTLSWNQTAINTDNWFTGASPTRITLDRAGLYEVSGAIQWPAMTPALGNDSQIAIRFLKNGALLGTMFDAASKDVEVQQYVSFLTELTAGQFLEMQAYQNSNAAQSVISGEFATWFSVVLIGT